MPLIVKCPGCQQPIKVGESLQGKQVKCPKCSKVLAIAAPKQHAAAAHVAASSGADAAPPLKLPPAKPLSLELPTPSTRQSTSRVKGSSAQATLTLPAAKRSSSAPSSSQGPAKTQVNCPGCQQALKLSLALAGKRVKCPKCATSFVVPAANQPADQGSAKVAAAKPNPRTQQPIIAAPSQPTGESLFDEVDVVDDTGFAGAVPGLSAGQQTFDAVANDETAGDDPFAGDPFAGDSFSAGGLGTTDFGISGGLQSTDAVADSTSAFSVKAPQAGAQFSTAQSAALPTPAKNEKQTKAATNRKANDAFTKGLIYRMPAMLGLGCAALNLVIVLSATVVGCMTWFPRIKVIGLIVFIAASTIGAQVYAINGFIGVLNMSDRNGGIHAAKGILACPFITAIVLGIGLGPFGLFLAAGLWVFMLLYNWPVGWWLWLKLEKKEAGRDFDEVDRDDVDVSSLLSKKPTEAAATPAWSPVGVAAPDPEEEKKVNVGMSPETKLKLMLAGGALAALLLVGGVVGVAVMAIAGSGDDVETTNPPPAGWHVATAAGVSMFFPSEPIEPEMGIGDMQCWTTYSEKTESFFLMAAMPSGSKLSIDGMMKNTARRLGGDVLGHRETTRGPMTGMTGRLSVSFKFPDMPVEAYQHEGRTVILGYASGSSLNSRGGGDVTTPAASPEEERLEKEIFFNSIHFAQPGFFGY